MKNFKIWLEQENEDAIKKYIDRLPLRTYHDDLYHGTTEKAAISIAKTGFSTYDHRELGSEFFSVSKNPRVIQLFGGSGFQFDANLTKVLVLTPFFYELLAHETGMGGFWDRYPNPNQRKIEKAKKLGLITRFGEYGIGNPQEFFRKYVYDNPKLKDVQGIFMPGFNSSHTNAESEIAITQSGLKILERSVISICIDGRWYDAEDGWKILKSRSHEVSDEERESILQGDRH